MNSSELPDWFADFKKIPTLPHDVHHLIRAFANEEIDFHSLAKIIETHPTISTRLIALANSAWANNSGVPVTSIQQTCLKLGLNIVRGVSIGLAVMAPFNVSYCPDFDIKRYWVSSMLVAQGASALALTLPAVERDEYFVDTVHTAGILHNLGLLCLADLKPRETGQAIRFKDANPELSLNQALRRALKTDYCQVGGYLAASWGVPGVLVAIITHQEDGDYQHEYWKQVLLVRAAAQMVECLFRGEGLTSYRQLENVSISDESQARVFTSLQQQFEVLSEMAKALFH